MNIGDWTQTGGKPIRQNTFKWLQDSILEAFGNVGKGPKVIVRYDNDQKAVYSSAYILFGCMATDTGEDEISVEAGAIFQEGEVFTVPAHVIAKSEEDYPVYYFDKELTDDPTGIKEYFSGVSHATRKIRQAKLVFSNHEDGLTALGAALTLSETKVVVSLGDAGLGTEVAQNFMNIAKPSIKEATLQSGWGSTHSGKLLYWRDSAGIVTVTCSLIPTSGSATNELLATLPVGYRPTYAVRAISRFNSSEGKNEFARILTNGQVKLELEDGTASYGDKGVTFTVKYVIPNE